MFSFTWDVIFKLSFSLILACFPLSVWSEREDRYRRRLDDMYERLEVLQHQVAVNFTYSTVSAGNSQNCIQSLQLNPVVPATSGVESRVSMQLQRPASSGSSLRQSESTSRQQPSSPIRKKPKPRPRAQSAPQPPTWTIIADPPIPPFNPQRKPRSSNLNNPINVFPPLPPFSNAPHNPSSRETGTPPPSLHSPPTDFRRKPRSPNLVDRVRNTFAPRPRSSPPPKPPSPKPPSPEPSSSEPSTSAKTLSPTSPPLPLSFWRG